MVQKCLDAVKNGGAGGDKGLIKFMWPLLCELCYSINGDLVGTTSDQHRRYYFDIIVSVVVYAVIGKVFCITG